VNANLFLSRLWDFKLSSFQKIAICKEKRVIGFL
jgi:hypothetical protein